MLIPPLRSQGVSRLLAELNATRVSLIDETGSNERRTRLLARVAEYLLVSLIVLVIAGIEVERWYFNTPPQPVWVCAFAAGLIGYAAVRVWFILPQLRTLGREREARRLLRTVLQGLCAKGYVLFEGVTGARGWSLGSVVVGPTGVFCLVSRFVPRGRDLSEKVSTRMTPRCASAATKSSPTLSIRRGGRRRGCMKCWARRASRRSRCSPWWFFQGGRCGVRKPLPTRRCWW